MKLCLFPLICLFLLQVLSSCEVYRSITEPQESLTPELLASIPLNKRYNIADKARNKLRVWRIKSVDSAYVYGKVTKFSLPFFYLRFKKKDSVAIQDISRIEMEEKKKGILYRQSWDNFCQNKCFLFSIDICNYFMTDSFQLVGQA